jgi:iron complex transport system permease protein
VSRHVFLVSVLLLAAAFAAALAVGSTSLSFADAAAGLIKTLRGEALPRAESLAFTVLFDLRLPRALAGALCGAALGAAGVVAQGLFRESLASPTVLGTEAGGSLAAALAFYAGSAFRHWLLLPLASFAGALGASLAVMGVAARAAGAGAATPVGTLLLAGFAMNALLGAGTSLFVVLSLEDPQRAAAALAWLVGGLAAKGWEHAAIAAGTCLVGGVLAAPLASRLDVLSLGEATAASLAVEPRALRRRALAAMAVLVGGAVSVAGAIPFVGLVVPHAARRLAGPGHARLLLVSAVNGATLVLLADLAARTLRAPAELQAGILTAFIGAPFFLALLLSRREDAA